MKIHTLAFLFRQNKIQLAMKKRGFGIGKRNGYGGKLEINESPVDGVIREIGEESLIKIDVNALNELGNMDFYFENKADWNQKVIIYRVDDFEGEPAETEEMSPTWFDTNEIPYQEMWAGDDKFMPYIVEGKKFKGEIHFSENGEELRKFEIKEIKDEKTSEIKMK